MIMGKEKFKNRGEKIKKIKSIKQLIDDGHFELALKEIRNFLDEFGYDCEVMTNYGKMLRKNNQVSEAIQVLNDLINYQEENNIKHSYVAARRELFKVYFINDYYEEAYKLFNSLDWSVDDPLYSQLEYIEKILKIKVGTYEGNPLEEPPFITKLLYYDEDFSKEHIREHLWKKDKEKHTLFNDIDIDTLIFNVKKVLPESKKIQKFALNDIYLFSFSKIGRDNHNLLKVITTKGTYDIVSMYPADEITKEYINDNLYLEYLEEKNLKIKRLSQIEKFNKRYSK